MTANSENRLTDEQLLWLREALELYYSASEALGKMSRRLRAIAETEGDAASLLRRDPRE